MSRTVNYGKSAFGNFLYLCLNLWLMFMATAASSIECDPKKCKGPIQHYHELRCEPIYKKPSDCCAVSYNCSHLSERSPYNCYVNGHVYNIGDKLKDEDRNNPCDIDCNCVKGFKDVATFTCAAIDCSIMRIKEGCYFKRKPGTCCDGEQICPEISEERTKCEIDGRTYLDGEPFYPSEKPELVCQCSKGYKGEYVAPFCEHISCGTELLRTLEIRENCAPVFYHSQIPQTSCTYGYRCQNYNDTVIHRITKISSNNVSEELTSEKLSSNKMCKFGNLTMEIGDELNQATDYSSVCVRCVCEVPPTPTCQRLPDNECDVTNHPLF
ncbi:PREDICTED: kielin/chordin-like protein [Ceratosolen solmsi marchali]|uniref:Kielin/chordin-like protein n=1 Tax=Ceratosolen solmsi marchali TaxID=326594 RepID=A0AAJ6YUS2_9HYME|nr:PREDICTED: kielin/chordin-like protein [Ceratosolen solmsi marchali]